MENKRLFSAPLPSDMEFLGDGKSFQDTICTMLMDAKGFESFAQRDLVFIAKHMKAYRVCKGNTIFREGDHNNQSCCM